MNKRTLRTAPAILAMAVIILDTKTVISGAQEGLALCMQSIIPALFPFIVLSGVINSSLLGRNFKLLSPFGRFTKIPKGTESLLLLGFLGGYPVGAQAVAQAYRAGSISSNTAKRMLGFCNNAGPAFLFGMLSLIFSNPKLPWILWAIHLFSALLVGYILPYGKDTSGNITCPKHMTLSDALKNAIKITATICGWVIIFRIVLSVCDKWILFRFPEHIKVLISGLLELSNGCVSLTNLSDEKTRFIYACTMLAFGGFCVGMQTGSVTQDLGFGYYFPGKVLQTLISVLFCLCVQPALFKNPIDLTAILIVLLIIVINISFLHRKKLWHLAKECSIMGAKQNRKEQLYAVSKKNRAFLQLLPARRKLF